MVRTRHLQCCGPGVQSLVGELRSHTPHGAAERKKRKKERKRDHVCGYERWALGERNWTKEVKKYKLPLQSMYILGM